MEKTKKLKSNSLAAAMLKGGLIAIVVSLVCILIFAFIVKIFGLSDGVLKVVNQVIKVVSILIGTFAGLAKETEKGLLKGLLIGLFYTFFAFVVFSALNGKFDFDKSLLTDILFGGITGAICGVIAVNTKKKNV